MKQMDAGLLLSGEIQTARSPIQQLRIFIKAAGQVDQFRRRRGRLGSHRCQIHHRNVAVCVVVMRLCERGGERELCSIRRKDRRFIRSRQGYDFGHRVILLQVQQIDVLLAAERQQRIASQR